MIITVLPFLNDKPIKLFRFFLLASAACFLSVPAGAAVIYSGLQNIPIATGFDGVYVDVEDINSATNHSSGTITGWDVNLFFGGVGEFNQANFQPVRVNAADPGSAMLNLPLGTPIDDGVNTPWHSWALRGYPETRSVPPAYNCASSNPRPNS